MKCNDAIRKAILHRNIVETVLFESSEG